MRFGVEVQWPLATRLYRRHKAAVVRLDTAGGVGTGFVYHSKRHIATAFHVVSAGRPITVALPEGGQRQAKVVAIDPAHDLAILEMDAPIEEVSPLVLWERDPLPIGTPVVMIGHPFSPYASREERLAGLLNWTVTTGVVSGCSTELVQTDAAVNPGNSGGPMLAPDGRVVGVVSFKLSQAEGIAFAIAANHLEQLSQAIGTQPTYRGRWTSTAALSLATQSENDLTLLGLMAGFGYIIRDRYTLGVRLGFFRTNEVPDDDILYERSQNRTLLELDVTRRFMLLLGDTIPLHLHLGGGVAVGLDSISEGTLQLRQNTLACSVGIDQPCPVQTTVDRSDRSELLLRPMAVASALLGGLELQYALLADVETLSQSAQQISLGFVF